MKQETLLTLCFPQWIKNFSLKQLQKMINFGTEVFKNSNYKALQNTDCLATWVPACHCGRGSGLYSWCRLGMVNSKQRENRNGVCPFDAEINPDTMGYCVWLQGNPKCIATFLGFSGKKKQIENPWHQNSLKPKHIHLLHMHSVPHPTSFMAFLDV